ncbi:MAG: hypothetical protein H7210_00140 [Pyrinomonadaceae bacterium]|nr:hypothetical protein [Phycisphaerales bacterium]
MAPRCESNQVQELCARALPVCVCALAAAAVLSLGGCYQRTVGARGIGAASHEVSEPYQETGQLDDWIFGPTNENRQQTPMSRNSTRMR